MTSPIKLACTTTLMLCLCGYARGQEADPALPKAPPGWKVEIVAKAPQIQHPSVVTTSPDGRIFVGEDPVDMHLPSDAAADRILCFHPDGKVTVFAEKLHAVFGIEYVDGKVFVHHPPFVSVFDDNDGAGGNRTDLIASTNPKPWGGSFNDHIPANFRLGMDGFLYMSVGDKGIYGAVGTDGSKAELRGGGVLRLRPDGSGLEVFASGTRNHLDVALNAEDDLFSYDNTDDGRGWWTRYTHMVDGGFYGYPWDYWPDDATPEKVQRQIETGTPGQPYTLWRMSEYGGGSPCGAVSYNEDALPAEYHNNNFHCEWGKGRVERFVVERSGATYRVVKRHEDFLTPGGELRPLGICVTHDGTGFLITDWNYGGWKNAEAGGKVGRLIRMTYTGEMNPTRRPDWYVQVGLGRKAACSLEDLVAALSHPARSVRMVASRRLANPVVGFGDPDELKQAAIPLLVAVLKDPTAPAHAKWHAIWTLDAIDGGAAARQAIVALVADESANPSVRRQAARQLGTRRAREGGEALIDLMDSANASLRFHGATALGRVGDPAYVADLLAYLKGEDDLFVRYAAFTACNRIGRADPAGWAQVVGGLGAENPQIHTGAMFAMRDTFDVALISALAAFAADGGNYAESRARALASLAPLHRQPEPWNGEWWGTQPVLSPRPAKAVEWAGTKLVHDTIAAALKDADPVVRLAAIRAVQVAPDPSAGDVLAGLFRDERDPAVRTEVLRALAVSSPGSAAGFIGDVLRTPAEHAALIPDAIAVAEKIGGPEMSAALVGVASAADVPAESLVLVIQSLGRLKDAAAVAALSRQIGNVDPKVAAAAADALGSIGGDAAVTGLVAGLGDVRPEVRRAAAGALGVVASPAGVEPLLAAYGDPEVAKEAIVALAATPDLRALDAYLAGLASPDGVVRERARAAVTKIAPEALPLIEQKLDATPLPPQVIDELQRLYTAYLPVRQWAIVGPFPLKADAPFDVANPPAAGEFPGIDGPAKWLTVDSGERGMVDLGSRFIPNSKAAVYAVARFDSRAERDVDLLTGSDDYMTLWLNGEQLLDDAGNSGWNPDEQHAKGRLRAGANVLVARVGNDGGGWQFSVALSGERTGKLFEYDTTKLDPEVYAKFAAENPGDAGRGKAIFFNTTGVACVKCHKVDTAGEGGDVGPALAGVGAKYDRAKLVESILYPSKQIFDGYQQTLVRTKAGKMLAGSVRGETETEVTLVDADNARTVLKKSDIGRMRVSELSLMPDGLHTALKPEEFADLIAYLASLKEAPPAAEGGK
jgi:putative membrane-bound dehydrogenase-like protein